MAREQAATGDLGGARDRLLGLLDAGEHPSLRADLSAVEQDLAERRLAEARARWARGSLRQARRELSAALVLVPRSVEAHFLLAQLDRTEERERARRQAFCSAVDERRWEQALWRLAGDTEGPWQSCRGRAVDLMGRAWQQLDHEFQAVMIGRDLRAMESVVARAVALGVALPDVLAVSDVDGAGQLASWRGAIVARQAVERLIREAHVHDRSLQSALAYKKICEASLIIPADGQLRARVAEHQQRLTRELLTRLDATTRARDWGAALSTTDALDELGWQPTTERPLPVAEMRRRHTDELLAEADRFERRGLPGNALLATLEASAASDHPADLLSRAARLRETVASTPLVVLASRPAADRARTGSTVVVNTAEPEYSERRTVLVRQMEGVVTRTDEQWRDNPVYVAELRRRVRGEERVTDLRAQWQHSDQIDRAHAERRYRAAIADLERIRQRISMVPEQLRHSVWEAQLVTVEIHEVEARLERRVIIVGRDGAQREELIVCEERVTDRHTAADPERGHPENPAELPDAQQIERRLVLASEIKLAALLARLIREERRVLVNRVDTVLGSGRVAEGVELAVRALLMDAADQDGPTSQRLRRLLTRWTERAPRTFDALVRH